MTGCLIVESIASAGLTAFALCTVLGERIGTAWSRIGFTGITALTAVAREEGRASALRIFPGAGGLALVYVLP